jgi:hypothetical protein
VLGIIWAAEIFAGLPVLCTSGIFQTGSPCLMRRSTRSTWRALASVAAILIGGWPNRMCDLSI